MLIAISGLAGSGKDTAADFLVKNHQFVKVGFADPLKRICKEIFDFSDDQLWGSSEMRNAPDERYLRFAVDPMCLTREVDGELIGEYRDTKDGREFSPLYLTPRYALQRLGTEYGRDCYPNIWVEYCLRVVQKILYQSGVPRSVFYNYSQQDGLTVTSTPIGPKPKGVVIPDLRWPSGNEGAGVRAAGGLLLRMKRGTGLPGDLGRHQSETAVNEAPDSYFDAVVDNGDWELSQLESFMADLVRKNTTLEKNR